MGYLKKIWQDRISQYPNRRIITDENGMAKTVTVSRNEGTVTQEGDPFNATVMNDLENRISDAFRQGGGGGGGGGALADLTDVAITTPSNGQVLQYEALTDTWKNENIAVVASFSDLSDVSLSTLHDNDVPVFNSTTQKWENRTGYIPFKDISGTLAAGETTITLSSGYITTDSVIDIYVDDGTNTDSGIQPTSKTVATGSITLTFLPQSVNIKVMARISCEAISVGGLNAADFTPIQADI